MIHFLFRTSDDSYTPDTSSSEDYKSVTERTSAAISLKHQWPAVTLGPLGLNDSAKGEVPCNILERTALIKASIFWLRAFEKITFAFVQSHTTMMHLLVHLLTLSIDSCS